MSFVCHSLNGNRVHTYILFTSLRSILVDTFQTKIAIMPQVHVYNMCKQLWHNDMLSSSGNSNAMQYKSVQKNVKHTNSWCNVILPHRSLLSLQKHRSWLHSEMTFTLVWSKPLHITSCRINDVALWKWHHSLNLQNKLPKLLLL